MGFGGGSSLSSSGKSGVVVMGSRECCLDTNEQKLERFSFFFITSRREMSWSHPTIIGSAIGREDRRKRKRRTSGWFQKECRSLRIIQSQRDNGDLELTIN
jgi:hypothetical protein